MNGNGGIKGEEERWRQGRGNQGEEKQKSGSKGEDMQNKKQILENVDSPAHLELCLFVMISIKTQIFRQKIPVPLPQIVLVL